MSSARRALRSCRCWGSSTDSLHRGICRCLLGHVHAPWRVARWSLSTAPVVNHSNGSSCAAACDLLGGHLGSREGGHLKRGEHAADDAASVRTGCRLLAGQPFANSCRTPCDHPLITAVDG